MLFRLLAVAVFVLGILGIARQDAPVADSGKGFLAVVVIALVLWLLGDRSGTRARASADAAQR